MKALELLKTNKTVNERAEKYVDSIKRNIQRDVIDAIKARKEGIEDKIFELSNFTLDTNLNSGKREMTRELCEERFKKLIDLEYELTLIEVELREKQKSFDMYFTTAPANA